MIILTRKIGEQVTLGKKFKVKVLGFHENLVRLGIDAPLTESVEWHEAHEDDYLSLKNMTPNLL